MVKLAKMFAFTISFIDMVRKLRSRYENPIDYIDTIVERAYKPGAAVTICLDEALITISSPVSIDRTFFKGLQEGRVAALAAAIPPVADYMQVEIASGQLKLTIDKDRNVNVSPLEIAINGTQATLQRSAKSPDKVAENVKRLKRLYTGSDMQVVLNGENLTATNANAFHFEKEGDRGTINYDPCSAGGLHFFSNGRYVASEKFITGVDINLHAHGLQTTTTKSKMILRGEGYERLQSVMPEILLQYLNSPEVERLRKNSEISYQTLLRMIFDTYKDSNSPLTAHITANLALNDNPALAEVRKLLSHRGVEHAKATTDGTFSYDSATRTLHVPNKLILGKSPLEIAAGAVPHVSQDRQGRLRAYSAVVKAAQE